MVDYKNQRANSKNWHLKIVVGFIILIIFVPILWLITNLRIQYPSVPIYDIEFIIVVVTVFLLIWVSSRIIERRYKEKKD